MEKKKGTQSWRISDELWEEIKEYIPKKRRDPNKHYQKAPGQGRPGVSRPTGAGGNFLCSANRMSVESCSARIWVRAAVFTGTFKNGKRQVSLKNDRVLSLEKYDELEGIGWEWQSVDGCMIKAPLARESVGHNPTDRGKNGDKTQRFN